MKSEFSSPAQKQESSPEGKLELNYNTQIINNQNLSRHPELDSRHSVLDTESKTPKLRFKEFSGDWEEKSLEFITKESISYGIVQAGKHIEDGVPYIKSSNVGAKINLNELQCTSREIHYKYRRSAVHPNDIVFSLRGNIGQMSIVPEEIKEANLTQGTARISVNNENNTFFVYFQMMSNSITNIINAKSKGSTFQEISLGELRKISILVPTLDEQQKIASFFSAVDSKIDQLTRKKELLKQYKKGVMQKIFSQELQFKADDGSEFPEWEEKLLKDVATKKSSNISANKIEENFGDYIIYGASGILKKVDFFEESEDYISIVKDGAGVGRIFYCKGKSSVLGTMDIIKPKSELHTYFLYCLLENIDFVKYVTGSTIPHIYFKDYSNEKCEIPSFNEQTKIANFLSVIDTKIDLVTKQLDEAKNFKKGLLQQMFV